MKAVTLRPEGEAPIWGVGKLDQHIVEAPNWTFDEQRKLFFGFAAHLYANRLIDEPDDHSDDDQWFRDLAAWLHWTEEQLDQLKQDAAREAFKVGSWEIDEDV